VRGGGGNDAPALSPILLPPYRKGNISFQAPHHGSHAANTPDLAAWARPRVVVACDGAPRNPGGVKEPYSLAGTTYLSTFEQGAVTIHSHQSGLAVETFVTGKRWVLRTERRGEE
jgi:beta-lactamase superfamily II metal-dependent hydrolase